jgi:hypothetical protein
MCAGGGDIPSILCARADIRPGTRADIRPGTRADIRHSNRGNGDPRQLWLEVSFQRLRRERG